MEHPQKFGKYNLLERIAVGGMAEIYKAQTTGVGGFEKVLAIKRLHPKYSDDSDFINMLIDEAKIAVQLSHSNICQIFDLDLIDEHFFICMEYINGRDLNRLLRRVHERKEQLPLDIACFILKEACSGLDYAHRKVGPDGRHLSIIHRDISPQNILVSWEGEVKIVDFGIAKATDRAIETESGIIKGKFYYMSPEHACGQQIDHRSDIFSLGIVLYEALTGDFLYSGQVNGDESLLNRVKRAEIPKPISIREEIPLLLEQIVLKALAKDPANRFQSAASLGDAINRFLYQYYPRMGRPALASYMSRCFTTPHHVASEDESHNRNMSRVDYQVEQSSLIYNKDSTLLSPQDKIMREDDPVRDTGRGSPTKKVSKTAEDTRDTVPDKNQKEEVYLELSEEDFDIISDQDRGRLTEQTVVHHTGHGKNTKSLQPADNPLHQEAIALDSQEGDPLDEEPTQVYRPQAFLAGEPNAPRGPLQGEVTVSHQSSSTPTEEEATVITSIDNVVRSSPRHSGTQPAVPPMDHSSRSQAMVPAAQNLNSPMMLAVLFLLVFLLGAMLTFGGQLIIKSLNSSSSAPQFASYTIETQPSDAQVFLNDIFEGRTPLYLTQIPLGENQTLKLELEGYQTLEHHFIPETAEDHLLPFELNRLGRIYVTTTPPEANISINDDSMCGDLPCRSPIEFNDLDMRNRYQITASLPGFLNERVTVNWENSGDTSALQEIALTLHPITSATPGSSSTTSPPSSTLQTANSRDDSRTLQDENISRSERTDRSRTADSGSNNRRERTSTPEAVGTISVRAVPDGQVFVDGEMISDSTPLHDYELAVGSHRVKVYYIELQEFSEERTIRVGPDERRTVSFIPRH